MITPVIDTTINSAMISIKNPVLTKLSELIAITFDTITLTIIALIIATYIFITDSRSKSIILAGTMVISGGIIATFKEIFQRARPLNMLVQESNFAFPSGHATIAVVFLGLMTYLFSKKESRKQTIAITTALVIFIGFTRIYLRVHWATDVLAGFILGATLLLISIRVFEKYRYN